MAFLNDVRLSAPSRLVPHLLSITAHLSILGQMWFKIMFLIKAGRNFQETQQPSTYMHKRVVLKLFATTSSASMAIESSISQVKDAVMNWEVRLRFFSEISSLVHVFVSARVGLMVQHNVVYLGFAHSPVWVFSHILSHTIFCSLVYQPQTKRVEALPIEVLC